MELAIIKKEALTPAFINKDLNRATKKIATIGTKVAKNFYDVARVLAKVAENECYKDDGFKSAADYAEKVFGFKKSMAYSLIKIGKEYTDPELPASNLPHEDGEDFTVSQLDRVLPLERDKVVELVNEKEITPKMTIKEISDVVKRAKDSENDAETPENDGEGDGEGSTTPTTATAYDKAKKALYKALSKLHDELGNWEGVVELVNDYIKAEYDGETMTEND